MKIIDRYFCKQILIGFLLISFSLMSIIWLSQSLRFLDLITSKGISAGIFIKLTSLLMPRIFTILSPIALFTSIIFTYNRMLSDQELVVISSSGVTPSRLAKPAVIFGLLLLISNIYIMNFGIPMSEKSFKDLEWRIKNNVSQLMFRDGEFTNLQKQLTVFVSGHDDDGTVSNIIINDERNPKVKSILTAEKGVIVQTDQGPRIILINGNRQEINHAKNSFSSAVFSKYSVDFGLKGSQKKRKDSVRTHSFEELITALDNESIDAQTQRKWFVEANRRITTPFMGLVFALIACVGLLTSNFNRRGQSKIIFSSIAAIILIQAIDLTSGNWASKSLWWLILLYANILLPIIFCTILLLKPNLFRSLKYRFSSSLAEAQ